MDQIEFLPIHVLREPKIKLRGVNRDSVEYLELRDSIREKGILQSLLVRPVEGGYEIINGLQRYTAAREVGRDALPCIIRECSDDEALVLMLQANAISPETKQAEYAQQLKRLLVRNPGMTQGELACLIRKQPRWVGKCLDLTNLLKEIQVMVDRGEIPIENAYKLATIPRSMQKDYVDRAKVMPAREFKPLAAACVKQFREAVKQGKMDAFYSDEFRPEAHLHHVKEIVHEIEKKEVGALICAAEDCLNVLDGFYAGLRWACHLDKASVRQQEAGVRARREREVLDAPIDSS